MNEFINSIILIIWLKIDGTLIQRTCVSINAGMCFLKKLCSLISTYFKHTDTFSL